MQVPELEYMYDGAVITCTKGCDGYGDKYTRKFAVVRTSLAQSVKCLGKHLAWI